MNNKEKTFAGLSVDKIRHFARRSAKLMCVYIKESFIETCRQIPYSIDGKLFYCKKISIGDSYYLDMTVEYTEDSPGKTYLADISIPHEYVSYILRKDQRKQNLGFHNNHEE